MQPTCMCYKSKLHMEVATNLSAVGNTKLFLPTTPSCPSFVVTVSVTSYHGSCGTVPRSTSISYLPMSMSFCSPHLCAGFLLFGALLPPLLLLLLHSLTHSPRTHPHHSLTTSHHYWMPRSLTTHSLVGTTHHSPTHSLNLTRPSSSSSSLTHSLTTAHHYSLTTHHSLTHSRWRPRALIRGAHPPEDSKRD